MLKSRKSEWFIRTAKKRGFAKQIFEFLLLQSVLLSRFRNENSFVNCADFYQELLYCYNLSIRQALM